MILGRDAILVATCGNRMAGDDGFGPAVAEALLSGPAPAEVEVIDLGMNPTGLLERMEGRRALVVVDAAWSESGPVGTLIECDWDSPGRPELASQRDLSTHGLTVAGQVELARRLGVMPGVVRLMALMINPAAVGDAAGEGLGAMVQEAVRRIKAFAATLARVDGPVDRPGG